ncbi:alpha/beta fold hydrolase [Streptomyces sp. DSM 42041]|uniref:Alpha/beta fold hydrolase n=1 Tax=Streptomyces hazeniae TaxID=3075538 RepID=A0ABU2NXW9_9ACTN|nr:alpha/beta fold hydrolase [Streptomyces sp. DSM 42041]MDT0381840.1 alpha/beta fold hydrolase [Streptomyces sp. DSM 42041]
MKLSWKRALRPAAALAGVLALVLLPATTAAAAEQSAPRSAAAASSGWNDFSCKPSAAHPRAVVLVHGTGGNSVDNWLGLAPYLVNRGYCVFSLDYGRLDGVPFFHGLGPIEDSAGELSAYVDRVLAATGTDEVDIVGHSQGGMMPRYYLKFLGGADDVHTFVGIAPSNHGTTLLGLTKLLDLFPGLEDAIGGSAPALTQQVAGSGFLQRLNDGGDTVPGVEYTVIATRYDQVVTPYRTQFLEGPNVRNILVQDRCPVDISEHLTVALVDRVTFHETVNALDPAHATPANCFS